MSGRTTYRTAALAMILAACAAGAAGGDSPPPMRDTLHGKAGLTPLAGSGILHGTVVSVNPDQGTFRVKPRDGGDDVIFAIDSDTDVRVDDAEATLADVRVDMLVEVSPRTGTAMTVFAYSPKASKD